MSRLLWVFNVALFLLLGLVFNNPVAGVAAVFVIPGAALAPGYASDAILSYRYGVGSPAEAVRALMWWMLWLAATYVTVDALSGLAVSAVLLLAAVGAAATWGDVAYVARVRAADMDRELAELIEAES